MYKKVRAYVENGSLKIFIEDEVGSGQFTATGDVFQIGDWAAAERCVEFRFRQANGISQFTDPDAAIELTFAI